MKIVEKNNNQLTLRSDPYGQIVLGLIFVLVGFAITYFICRSVDMHCERVAAGRITCNLTDKLLGVTEVGQRTISNIQSAEVDEHRDSDGDRTYQVMFLTTNGPVSLTGFSSSGYGAKADLAAQINDFIQGGQSSLDVQISMEWWALIFLLAFGGFGIGSIVTAKTVQIQLIRSEGALRIQKEGLFGGEQQEYLLREIQDVQLQSHYSSTRHRRGSSHHRTGSVTYRIAFITTSGEEIPLSKVYTSGAGDKQRAVAAMKEFLAPYGSLQAQNPFA